MSRALMDGVSPGTQVLPAIDLACCMTAAFVAARSMAGTTPTD